MFAVFPPLKVARTQRSPANLWNSSETHDTSLPSVDTTFMSISAPVVVASPSSFIAECGGRPMSIAEAEIRLGDLAVRPSVFLSGAGEYICWLVDENTRLLRVWNMRKALWQHTAPRTAQIPSFTTDEGLPLFIAELDDESLAFCTDYGAVSSLDHSVEFRFDDNGNPIAVTAFACRRDGDSMLTAVGTADGMILVAIKAGGERIVVDFVRAESDVKVLVAPLSSSSGGAWWRTWIPLPRRLSFGLSSSSSNGKNPSNSNNNNNMHLSSADGNNNDSETQREFTLMRFRTESSMQLWAANAASEFFLLDFSNWRREVDDVSAHNSDNGNGYSANSDISNSNSSNSSINSGGCEIRACWATNLSALLQRQCRVIAVTEASGMVYVLVYAMPQNGHEAGLEVVAMDARSGAVRQTISVHSVAALARAVAESPLHHTKLYANASQRTVTILAGRYGVLLNSCVGVRSPCASEDVHVLRGTSRPLGSALLPDGSVAVMDAAGPILAQLDTPIGGGSTHLTDNEVGDEVVDNEDMDDDVNAHSRANTDRSDACEVWRRSHFAGPRSVACDVAQQVTTILQTNRIDERRSLDVAVLSASDTIAAQREEHEGNWARSDLNAEDSNIMMYVTQNLVRRQQEHRRFVLAVLSHNEIEPQLRPDTIARIISAQEALLAMVAIRRLQNDGSYPLPPNPENLTLPPSYQGRDLTEYLHLARGAAERERCQQLLRNAIIAVADRIRGETGHGRESKNSVFHGRATAAEIAFSDPGRLSLVLQSVGEHLCEMQRSVLVDHRSKFDEAMAAATILILVVRAVDESREDMKRIYEIKPTAALRRWTSSEEEQYGVQVHIAAACTALSDALADVAAATPLARNKRYSKDNNNNNNNDNNIHNTNDVNTKINGNNATSSPWVVPLSEQLRLLDLIDVLMHFSFRNHSQGSPSFFANAMRCTLFREPFLREPLGYPFGAPCPSADATLGAAVLTRCEELALTFSVGDVLVAICLADIVAEPTSELARYEQLSMYCRRNPAVLGVALRALLAQRREWELQLLPQLLPAELTAVVTAARDAFLAKHAPQLRWLVDPTAFEALVEEGAMWPADVPYGEDYMTHKSRALAVAKLAWVAAGAPPVAAREALALHEAILSAQRRHFLPDARHTPLGAAEAVQRLLELEAPSAWATAAAVAGRVEETLRRDLLTQIVRRAKLHDAGELHRILQDGASELEMATALERTAIGGVILATEELQRSSDFVRICESVLDEKERLLLASWVGVRAAGAVS